MNPANSKDHTAKTIAFYHQPGDCFEIRAIGARNGRKIVDGGFFNDQDLAVEAVSRLVDSKRHDGIYVTLNPVNPALMGRASNRMAQNLAGTQDKDVRLLRRLLVDIDPERPSGVSSTDREHDQAVNYAEEIRRNLVRLGWPEPLVGDSGNGAHLVYALPDLPNSPENIDLLKRVLQGLSRKFSVYDGGVLLKVDEKVFNPSRISKVYGTLARKGDHTKERPHRFAQILSVPELIVPVSAELLNSIASPLEEVRGQSRPDGMQNGKFNLAGYLQHYGVVIKAVKEHGGSTLHVLEHCLFDESHRGGEAAIGQTLDGKLFYQCFHDSCGGFTWHDARAKISGSDHLGAFTPGGKNGRAPSIKTESSENESPVIDWSQVSAMFPRTDFPWDVLPETIAHSLQLLARACASSPIALPGAAVCILASTIGRLAGVSPKSGWVEPCLCWHGDIRPSGTGKTPAARELAHVLHEQQAKEHKRWAQEMEEFRKLSKKEQRESSLPVKERGYFCTNLTLEGIRDDLEGHPTGGLVVIQDELSAFIGGQNEYKQRGTDRESWLTLWDGKPARIVRKDRSVFITGARVSVFGGIQPSVFQRLFKSEDGSIYLSDGTVFRFLLTSEGCQFYELTAEAWSEDARKSWESLLSLALRWSDHLVQEKRTIIMMLDSEAKERFFSWRNDREGLMNDLPAPFRGFLPKAYSYALRLAGLIHCIHRFSVGKHPDTILTLQDMERGIRAVEFYLGQTVDAFQMLEDSEHSPQAVDERVDVLAGVLQELRGEVDSGRLAVGFVHERLNARLPDEQRLRTPKALGTLLRSLGLTLSNGKHDANGRRAASCLSWDAKTNSFIETRLQRLQHLQSITEQDSTDADIGFSMSAMSASPAPGNGIMQTLQTSGFQCLQPQTIVEQDSTDITDIADEFPKEEEFFI